VAEADDGLTPTALSRALDLAPSTIHRMLDRLGALGMVRLDRDRRHYVAVLEFYRLSALIVARTEFTHIARNALAALAEEAGETCFFAFYMPDERRIMYDARATGSPSIHIATQLHEPLALSCGAAGLAMLTALDPLETDAVLSDDDGPAVPRAMLFETLAEIRRSGYAASHDARIAGAVEIAAAVSGVAGGMVGALSIAIPESGFDPEFESEIARLVIDHAD